MSTHYPLEQIKDAIRHAAEKLFSEGSLADQTNFASALSVMPGLDLFPTTVPWRIEPAGAKAITGFSETLRDAAKDIHAQMVALGRVEPPTLVVSVALDEARLFEMQQAMQGNGKHG